MNRILEYSEFNNIGYIAFFHSFKKGLFSFCFPLIQIMLKRRLSTLLSDDKSNFYIIIKCLFLFHIRILDNHG